MEIIYHYTTSGMQKNKDVFKCFEIKKVCVLAKANTEGLTACTKLMSAFIFGALRHLLLFS